MMRVKNQENTEFIEGVPVEVLYDEESYYVSGVPQEVTVELGGANSNVKRLQATRNFEVVLDLRNREPGSMKSYCKWTAGKCFGNSPAGNSECNDSKSCHSNV